MRTNPDSEYKVIKRAVTDVRYISFQCAHHLFLLQLQHRLLPLPLLVRRKQEWRCGCVVISKACRFQGKLSLTQLQQQQEGLGIVENPFGWVEY
jgi:hypothetical protein